MQPNNQPNPKLEKWKKILALRNQELAETQGLESGQDVRMPMSDMADLSNALADLHLPDCYQPDQVTETPVQEETKEWHMSVTPDLRNYFIHKLALVIIPSSNAQFMLGRKMRDLFAFTKLVEGKMYKKANSWSEYYDLLNEKIYLIKTELETNRKKRKLELQQQP